MELLTKTGTYAPYEDDCESIARLEVYRLSEDEMHEIEEQVMPTRRDYGISRFRELTLLGRIWRLVSRT